MNQSQDTVIIGRKRDLGGFAVHRLLPEARHRSVGPYVFLDHMGPMDVTATQALDVRPHPHIGLATVTYLLDGRGMHRDSLGSKQVILPGDLNWMTAGRGIVHSERTPEEDRAPNSGKVLNGIQIWVALPVEHEECEPAFTHWPKSSFPEIQNPQGATIRVLLGEHEGRTSPVPLVWDTLFLDVQAPTGTASKLSFAPPEAAIFVVSGRCRVNGNEVGPETLVILGDPKICHLEVMENARIAVIGGSPFPEPRQIWWNFVSSRTERIRQAAEDWKHQRMGQVPGETDFIPLPETPLPS